MANYKEENHSKEVLSALDKAMQNACDAIGMTAETHAKEDPAMPLDTGRSKNSITYATKANEGKSYTYSDKEGRRFTEERGSGIKKNEIYLGSNVEYFPYIEFGSPTISARHVLKNAASTHGEEYKKLTEAAMKNA